MNASVSIIGTFVPNIPVFDSQIAERRLRDRNRAITPRRDLSKLGDRASKQFQHREQRE